MNKTGPAKPQQPSPLFLQANRLMEQGKVVEGAAIYRQILETNPRDSGSWTNLGLAMRRLDNFEASAACYSRALELNPKAASTWSNLGNTLVDLDRAEESLAAHAEAVRLDPGSYNFRKNYAIALREYHQFEKSIEQFEAAEKIAPGDPKLLWERCMSTLHLGNFEQGWKEYEVRWQQGTLPQRSFNAQRWHGEPLAGKTLLIHEEQGFGDTILAARYIPLIQKAGGRVILECKPPLHRLFSKIPGLDALAEPGAVTDGFDYYIPLMSLPGVFNTTLENIPPPPALLIPPLQPEAARRLAVGKGRFKVGIIWSGSVTFARNRKRAVEAKRFLELAEIPGVQLFSLQKGPCEPELAACGGAGLIPELAPTVKDFADTAAILKELDLVIMTDSAVAHLAGSVGCPVWNLLPYYPYWLYLTEREDSPWYSSMRLIRQPTPGDWDGTFARVKKDLAAAARKKLG